MKNLLVFVLFITAISATTAQTRTPDGRVNFVSQNDRFQFINPFDEREVNTKGTRYFLDSMYRPGELKTTNQLYTTELLYRFDQIERTVQVRLPDGKEMLLKEQDVVYLKINFGDRSVMFVSAAVPNGYARTLVQVIYQSPTMQLLRDSRKYIFKVKSDNLDGYSSEIVYNDVRKDYRYFFNKGGSRPFKEIKPDAKNFIKVMPERKALITRLFKTAEQKEGVTLTKLSNILKELDKKEVEKVENTEGG
jgi:hypothetical protein